MRRPRPALLRAAVATAAVVASAVNAGPTAAQRVAGTVTAAESDAPLAAAFVSLVDTAGRQRASALTGPDGRYLLTAPGPGEFAVRVELIGRTTVESEPLAMAVGRLVRHDVRVPETAVRLGAVAVSTRASGCRTDPGEGGTLQRLWDEARKALNVVAWGERERLLRYDIETYRRDLSPVSLRVVEEERDTVGGLTVARPFRTLAPGALHRDGYVQRNSSVGGGQWVYYGPDAEVILSDGFVDRHCFWVEPDAGDRAWVGLGFRPRERRRESDIRGVLWLDRETAELRVLEYRYTQLPRGVRHRNVGGRLEFARLPWGAWIVQRWWIRTPRLSRAGRLGAIQEAGAVVLDARSARDAPVLADRERRGVITGIVFDSVRAVPLAGAEVYLSGTEHRAVTDGTGGFRIDAPEGRYTLAFHHPALDTLGLYPAPVEVELGPGDSVAVRLPAPTWGGGAGEQAMFPLDPIQVVAEGRSPTLEARGFYRRSASRTGRFIDRDRIERFGGISAGVLLSMVASLSVEIDEFGEFHARASRAGSCRPTVYLDGAPLSPEATSTVLDALTARDVEGVEVYRSPGATPAEFNGDRNLCGSILVWTRRGGG